MITRKPANWRRELINKNNLTEYLNDLKLSDKNKSIILDYSAGLSYKEVSKKYGVSTSRVEEVLANFFYHLNKSGLYSFTKDPAYISMMMEQIRKEMQK